MKSVSFYCLILLMLIACKKNTTNSNGGAKEFFPDQIGDEWTYRVVDTIFTYQNQDSIRDYTMTLSVTDSTVLPGNIKAHIWIFQSPDGLDTNYVFQQNDTVNFATLNGTSINIERRYPIPLQLNNSWLYTPNSINEVTVDISSGVIIEQQVFANAFRIIGDPGMPDGIYHLEEWISSNIGIVSRYINTSSTTLAVKHHMNMSIVSYHLE